MGADNLRSFHRWQRWREIANLIPFVVVDRLGPSLYAAASPAAHALARWRIPEHAARSLPRRRAPAWTYLHGLKSALSSTALRALRGKDPGTGARKASPKKAAGKKAAGKKPGIKASRTKAAGIKKPAVRKAGAKHRAAAAKSRKPSGRKASGKKRR
jgi:nicotinate-nucleotide adenylyltransferase